MYLWLAVEAVTPGTLETTIVNFLQSIGARFPDIVTLLANAALPPGVGAGFGLYINNDGMGVYFQVMLNDASVYLYCDWIWGGSVVPTCQHSSVVQVLESIPVVAAAVGIFTRLF